MSLNISIYNNHNILVRIVKQHCKESLQLWQLNNIYNSKYEHKAMLWQVCVCVGFRREACQTIAQETGLKFTAWRYRDGRGGTTVLSSHRAKREVMLHLVFLTILSCGTISKVLNMIPVWQQTPATCCSRVFWDGWTSWWCITMCWLSQTWAESKLNCTQTNEQCGLNHAASDDYDFPHFSLCDCWSVANERDMSMGDCTHSVLHRVYDHGVSPKVCGR